MHDAHTLSAMILRQVARVAAGPPVLMKHTTAAAARPWRAEMRTKKDEQPSRLHPSLKRARGNVHWQSLVRGVCERQSLEQR